MWNNGRGIPVEMHATENKYVPELIFGTLLTSSNYNDSQRKVTGGRNGYGAKLCNIFSSEFTVETASNESKKSFKMVIIISSVPSTYYIGCLRLFSRPFFIRKGVFIKAIWGQLTYIIICDWIF